MLNTKTIFRGIKYNFATSDKTIGIINSTIEGWVSKNREGVGVTIDVDMFTPFTDSLVTSTSNSALTLTVNEYANNYYISIMQYNKIIFTDVMVINRIYKKEPSND